MPFETGTSGNPAGKRRGTKSAITITKQHAADALKVMVEIMKSPSASIEARLQAAESILSYANGNNIAGAN